VFTKPNQKNNFLPEKTKISAKKEDQQAAEPVLEPVQEPVEEPVADPSAEQDNGEVAVLEQWATVEGGIIFSKLGCFIIFALNIVKYSLSIRHGKCPVDLKCSLVVLWDVCHIFDSRFVVRCF